MTKKYLRIFQEENPVIAKRNSFKIFPFTSREFSSCRKIRSFCQSTRYEVIKIIEKLLNFSLSYFRTWLSLLFFYNFNATIGEYIPREEQCLWNRYVCHIFFSLIQFHSFLNNTLFGKIGHECHRFYVGLVRLINRVITKFAGIFYRSGVM